MDVCIHVYIYIYIYICMYMCVCVYIYIYIFYREREMCVNTCVLYVLLVFSLLLFVFSVCYVCFAFARIAHYEYIASAKMIPVLREAMVFAFKPWRFVAPNCNTNVPGRFAGIC